MDRYDEEVAYLRKHPDEVFKAWNKPFTHRSGCLFGVVDREREWSMDCRCGCLTEVRSGHAVAATDVLTRLIRKDPRVPRNATLLSLDVDDEEWSAEDENVVAVLKALPVFAEYNRLIDRELGRTPPPPYAHEARSRAAEAP